LKEGKKRVANRERNRRKKLEAHAAGNRGKLRVPKNLLKGGREKDREKFKGKEPLGGGGKGREEKEYAFHSEVKGKTLVGIKKK